MTDITEHARLSPSGSHKWMACVGSVAMEDGIVEEPSEYADEGTCAHAVAAMCLTERKPATAYVGRRIEVGKARTYEFREDMAEPVQAYVDRIREYAGGAGDEHDEMIPIHVEQRVPISHITGEPDAEGTADAVIISADGKEIQVHDLKFGRGVVVNAERNTQLMLYGLGVLLKFDLCGDIERVRLVIHQPRLNHLSEWDCSTAELKTWGETVAMKAAKAAMTALQFKANWIGKPDDLQYLVPGEHCSKGFCKARATCPALAKFVTATVGADFEDLTQADAKDLIERDGATPDIALLGKKMAAIDIIDDWCRAVRAKVEAVLFERHNDPEVVKALGHKLVQGRAGNRAWSEADEVEKLLKSFRLKKEEMYTFTLISPTAAEKLAPKFGKDGKPKPNQAPTPIGEKQWQKLQPLIRRSEGKASVAPIDDPRPPLVLTPTADDFDDATHDVSDLV
jgi:hypothetical protein